VPSDPLWAPWRLSYITATKDSEADGCFLCRYRDSRDDRENFVVARGEHSFVVLNRFPYNNGHLLVAPLAHKAELSDLDDAELLTCMHQLRQMVDVLGNTVFPHGYNVGSNLGQVAGAGLPGHLHWHLVPRWSGDTNFMTTIGDVTVIPQSLAALYELLQQQLGTADGA